MADSENWRPGCWHGEFASSLLIGSGPDSGWGEEHQSGTIDEAASQEIVVLAVPVSRLPDLLRQIKGSVRAGALVIDVCAVKAQPTRWMKAILPRSARNSGSASAVSDRIAAGVRSRDIRWSSARSGSGGSRLARSSGGFFNVSMPGRWSWSRTDTIE